jgi:hypothetical protein
VIPVPAANGSHASAQEANGDIALVRNCRKPISDSISDLITSQKVKPGITQIFLVQLKCLGLS